MKKTYSHTMRNYMAVALVASVVLFLCGLMLVLAGMYIAATVECVLSLVLFFIVMRLGRKRKEMLAKYIHTALADDGISENALASVPMPMVVCSIDGTIRWYNDLFRDIFTQDKFKYEVLDDCIPGLKWSYVLKYPSGQTHETRIGDFVYRVCWRMIKDKIAPNKMGDHFSVFFYMKDITEEKLLEEKYDNEHTDVMHINIDNYDDLSQKANDDTIETAGSRIRQAITSWVNPSNALIKKTDRERYLVLFEHRYLQGFIDSKFDVVENVRKIAEELKFPLNLSIGIGTGGSLKENEARSRHALDLALGRGGGQVCLKDDNQFKFFGGKTGEYERSSRVKARAVATAFKDFIRDSDNVIFVGHSSADYDCFGAAVGLQRAVRKMGKRPYVVHERVSPGIDTMYELLRDKEEYTGMFVDENEVYEEITPDTLLVVLDTHRPSMLPCEKILERVNKIVLIDHHRRSTEFLDNCSLIYHEPYASSTCEMVTELLEYMDVGSSLTKEEAQCLYTGILMDTKNFILKTGVRTFEAASYLRKLGLDTVEVRKMFCSSREDYAMKSEIVNSSKIINNCIAVAGTEKTYGNMRIIASQAADDMLHLENVRASVAVYRLDGGVGFCARSLGGINVQLIMEKLGGGGHLTVAGAMIKGIDVEQGIIKAEEAVKEYLSETE